MHSAARLGTPGGGPFYHDEFHSNKDIRTDHGDHHPFCATTHICREIGFAFFSQPANLVTHDMETQ